MITNIVKDDVMSEQARHISIRSTHPLTQTRRASLQLAVLHARNIIRLHRRMPSCNPKRLDRVRATAESSQKIKWQGL